MEDTIIFFDINGTIIKRDSRTDIPFSNAVDSYLEIENGMDGVNTSARSDKDVFIEVLGKFKREFTDELWNGFLKVYEEQLKEFYDTDVWRENADAVSYIKYLHDKGYKMALITGELSMGAEYKLKKLGVWEYFSCGGYGEDGLVRFEIADSALRKASKLYKKEFKNIYVIGDTILDIKTARHLGAKIISITTGSNTREELEELCPEIIIDTFSELRIF